VRADDNSDRIFVVEQGGLIKVFEADGDPLGTFLDVSTLVSGGFEQGLLGLAFDPNYESNRRFYVFYTDTNWDLKVVRYLVSPTNPNQVQAGSESLVISIPHPGEDNHNGGQLNFGPDGYLYIATGDGGGVGDPNGNGQNNDQLLGKILRIDVMGASGYTSPTTNPLWGSVPGRDEIWATGLRNPWRFTFDRQTNDLFIADVGQGSQEEVDFQQAGATGLGNYGWRIMEGDECYNAQTCNMSGLTLPILTYAHGAGDCSITGGYRYRGASALFAAKYFYGDYCSGRIWAATLSGATWTSSLLLDTDLNISSFGEDESGELYVADASGGVVYRLGENTADTDGDGVGDVTDNCPTDVNPQQEHADPNVRPNGPMIGGDDATYIMHDNSGDACDTDDDNDGRSDANEMSGTGCSGIATNPLLQDTDGDRLTDTWECAHLNEPPPAGPAHPTNPSMKFMGSGSSQSDGDRIPDLWEQRGYDANITSTDSDGDGCHDMVELASIDGNKTIADADRLAIARRALGIWGPDPQQDVVMDVDKGGTVNDPDRLFVARAALLTDWLPKNCP
jgi:hypothetical protein